MRKRRFIQVVMFSGVLAAGAVGVAPPAFAGGSWHPVHCVSDGAGGYVPPSGTPTAGTGDCTTTGANGKVYPYYVVPCDTSKFKGSDLNGIVWQRGDSTGYQCVASTG